MEASLGSIEALLIVEKNHGLSMALLGWDELGDGAHRRFHFNHRLVEYVVDSHSAT